MFNKNYAQVHNPQESANWLSRLTFWYLNGFLYKSYRHGIDEQDVFDVRQKDSVRRVTDDFKRHWKKEQTKSKPRFYRALIQNHLSKDLILLLIPYVEELCRLGQVLTLGRLLNHFENQTSKASAVGFAFLLGFLSIILGIAHHTFFYEVSVAAMRARTACCNIIHQKMLKMSLAARSTASSGYSVNMMGGDMNRIDNVLPYAFSSLIAPFQLIIVLTFSVVVMGWTSIVGILLFPLTVFVTPALGIVYRKLRKQSAPLSDQRILYMNELLTGIQVVKMSSWEKPFQQIIEKIRFNEIKKIFIARAIEAVNPSLSSTVVKVAIFLMITLYLAVNHHLPPSGIVFQVLTAISPMRIYYIIIIPLAGRLIAETLVAANRFQKFLNLEEMKEIPRMTKKPSMTAIKDVSENAVELKKTYISWSLMESERPALKDISFCSKWNSLTILCGQVACGKSTVLATLIGETNIVKGDVIVSGNVSYCSQEPWLFHGTIRQNILFGSSYDAGRYHEVIGACNLNQNTNLNVEIVEIRVLIGDRGTGLSGGQRARVSLARSLYKSADIYLLDEPLGAVDAKTGAHIFKNAILGFLSNKTVIVATHQLQCLHQADNIVFLENGTIRAQGKLDEILNSGVSMSDLIETENRARTKSIVSVNEELDETISKLHVRRRMTSIGSMEVSPASEIVEDELNEDESSKGNVGSSIYLQFLRYGAQSYIVLIAFLILVGGTQALYVVCDWWLSLWLSKGDALNETTNYTWHFGRVQEINYQHDWNVFLGLTMGCIIAAIVRSIITMGVVINASRVLHNKMFFKILKAPLYFFHSTPAGVILNRFSRDLSVMDDLIPSVFQDSLECVLLVLAMLIYISIVNYYTLLVVIPFVVLIVVVRQLYIRCGQDIKRLEHGLLSGVMKGLPTIRSFGMQQQIQSEFETHLDHASRTYNLFLTTQRFFQLRIELLSAMFITVSSIIFIFLNTASTSAEIGLSLSYAITLMNLTQWAIRQSADLTTLMISVERILEYNRLEQESQPDKSFESPDPTWPTKGNLELRNVSFKYSPDGPVVFRCDYLKIKPGDKVGIVGRTGAGKSTFFNMLLRLGEVEGEVELDALDLSRIKLQTLRSAISLIPQEPVFFTGSLRKNLDPFDEYNDADIWDALEQVKMRDYFSLRGLETGLTEQGSNLSIGQRQLLCLARALLRQCKVMLVDEATANVDKETDKQIQLTIRTRLRDKTVITIAHRLVTIVDSDYVIVIDNGRLAEIGKPFDLLNNEQSIFFRLAAESGKSEVAKLKGLVE